MTAKSLWQSQWNLLLCFGKLQKDLCKFDTFKIIHLGPYGLLIDTQRAKNFFLSNFFTWKQLESWDFVFYHISRHWEFSLEYVDDDKLNCFTVTIMPIITNKWVVLNSQSCFLSLLFFFF